MLVTPSETRMVTADRGAARERVRRGTRRLLFGDVVSLVLGDESYVKRDECSRVWLRKCCDGMW